jgi:hypothetical protein
VASCRGQARVEDGLINLDICSLIDQNTRSTRGGGFPEAKQGQLVPSLDCFCQSSTVSSLATRRVWPGLLTPNSDLGFKLEGMQHLVSYGGTWIHEAQHVIDHWRWYLVLPLGMSLLPILPPSDDGKKKQT